MEAHHQTDERGAAEPEIEPGTGPLSNEALDREATITETALGGSPEAVGDEQVSSSEFNMEAYHQTHEEGGASEPEVEPGTGPLSNEALDQHQAAGQQASGDGMLVQSESPSPERSHEPASDELESVSEQYSPASDELDIENASAGEETEQRQEAGPYSPASDELNVGTAGGEKQVEHEQVEYEPVEYEQVDVEQRSQG
jgi:hypothetical protein